MAVPWVLESQSVQANQALQGPGVENGLYSADGKTLTFTNDSYTFGDSLFKWHRVIPAGN